jgi:3-oxoacyl-[acyl-carrier-protein] synthase II
MTKADTEVWITGIGLASSLGEGVEAHWEPLWAANPQPVIDTERFTPYSVHPMVPLDFSKQIPKRSDQNQMETWQRIGTYVAGLALEDAGIAKNRDLLDHTNLIVAAGIGERDAKVDRKVLETIDENTDADVFAKQVLPSALKPTLFLAQLSNLLAGNISIIHNVTGSSRTFMGEEMAGISAVENAVNRIRAGQGELFLVGGACNAERKDVLLPLELGNMLWSEPYASVWNRLQDNGGMVLGSGAVFLVLESKAHAMARGVKAYAAIDKVLSGHSTRVPMEAATELRLMLDKLADEVAGPLALLSGTSGFWPALSEEKSFFEMLEKEERAPVVRAYGSLFGHMVEAQFPLGIALAAMMLSRGVFIPPLDDSGMERAFEGSPEQIFVTGVGSWRGEGLALLKAV